MIYDIFISYSDGDKDKVRLIESELEGHDLFRPLVIAAKKDAMKPLAKKVEEGLKKETTLVIIPILTKKSISTQWINQEIGFAFAIKKEIFPIVASNIFDELKGFIHKQVDLPYCFSFSTNKAKENKEFIRCFRELLKKLEKKFAYLPIREQIKAGNLPKRVKFLDTQREPWRYF